MEREDIDRRHVLAAGVGMLLVSPVAALAAPDEEKGAKNPNKIDPDMGVTAPEDLMREHGVLNRCLLIYEAGIQRLRNKEEVSPQVFGHTAELIHSFVENYHEENEEKYFFTLFQNGKNADKPGRYLRQARGVNFAQLVHTLKVQHDAGRVLTKQILALSKPDAFRQADNQSKIIAAADSFIRMYRPHENWEDTVLYPAIRTVLTPKQVDELGERMEEDEHKILGDEGYEKNVVQVAAIEKALGIYDLSHFTPKA